LEWGFHRTQHLSAAAFDENASVFLERVSEDVVGGDEEPGTAATLCDLGGRTLAECIRVVGPVRGYLVALLVGDSGGRGAAVEDDLVALCGDVADRQRNATGGDVDERVDLFHVQPLPGDIDADVRLVEVVCVDKLYGQAVHLAPEIVDCHPCGEHRAWAIVVGVRPRHVGEHAHFDDAIVDFILCDDRIRPREQRHHCKRGKDPRVHGKPLLSDSFAPALFAGVGNSRGPISRAANQ
jgi:hypothetical protein